MKPILRLLLPVILFGMLLPKVFGEGWNGANDPTTLPGMEIEFSKLPLEGQLSHQPWSAWSWKSYDGGIAYRWQDAIKAWDYAVPSLRSLRAMNPRQRARLSPAEKLDLWRDRYDFSTTYRERERTSPQASSWFGLCHGWAIASLAFPIEPQKFVARSAELGEIPWGVSDVKAVLSYYAGEVSSTPIYTLGQRCYTNGAAIPSCHDVNAGALHVILASRVGLLGRGVIFERDPGIEIWNKPVFRYRSHILQKKNHRSKNAAPSTAEEIRIRTEIWYAERTEPQFDDGTSRLVKREYHYWLELDQRGRVVGGRYVGDDHPDFIWFKDVSLWEPGAERVRDLYQESIGGILSPPDDSDVPLDVDESTVVQYQCPENYSLNIHEQGMDQALQETRLFYCRNAEKKVIGPITFYMREICALQKQRASVCFEGVWPESLYLSLLGDQKCYPGSRWDDERQSCIDQQFVYGPFSQPLWSRCVQRFGKAACEHLAWKMERWQALQDFQSELFR